jgi:hypothetical protein
VARKRRLTAVEPGGDWLGWMFFGQPGALTNPGWWFNDVYIMVNNNWYIMVYI